MRSQIDATFFVLQVDLWDESGQHEKNVVRAASNSPATSISTATTTSFPPPPDRVFSHAPPPQQMPVYQHPFNGQMMVQAPQQNPYAPQMYPQPQAPSMYAPGPQHGFYAPQVPQQGYPAYQSAPPGPSIGYGYPQAAVMPSSAPPNGMFTRNLIGSLTVNAFTLRDCDGKEGHWFILQDLSVRTEGLFR